MRKAVTFCRASDALEAFAIARVYHGDKITHLMAKPNYVRTGKISPVVWEKNDNT